MKSAITVRIGAISTPAISRVHDELADRIGPERPQRVWIWSVTTIDPSSAAIPDPTRPASMSAGQHRPQLLVHHRRADQAPHDRAGPELVERETALQRQHRARVKMPVEQDDGQRTRARWPPAARLTS